MICSARTKYVSLPASYPTMTCWFRLTGRTISLLRFFALVPEIAMRFPRPICERAVRMSNSFGSYPPGVGQSPRDANPDTETTGSPTTAISGVSNSAFSPFENLLFAFGEISRT